MVAAKKRQQDEDEAKLAEYEEQRRIQREKEEEELRLLKEKQERRKKEREEEERMLAEKLKEDEERRRVEEAERREKQEAERAKKEEEKRKRQAMMQVSGEPGKPNFVIPEKKGESDKLEKFGSMVKAKQEMGLTKEQQEELKSRVLAEILKPMDFSGMSAGELRSQIKQMHQRICKLEAMKYDLEKRRERQEYDLKELNERQRQINRNKAMKKGLDPDQASSRYPPKVAVSSKYDRQIDRRNYSERKQIYDKAHSYPHFPNVPPPPTILEKKISGGHKAEGDEEGGGDDSYGGGQEEAVEEVEEEEEE